MPGRLCGGSKIEDAELTWRLRLAYIRQPRCLRCGEASVEPLNFDENRTSSIIHTCGSHLFMVPEDPDAPRFIFKPKVIRIDPERRRV